MGVSPVDGLPPVLRQFFDEYRVVESNAMSVASEEMSAWARDADFVRVGFDLEHADVVVHRREDTVYVVEDDGRAVPNLENPLPTIWHYLVYVVETSRMFGQLRK